VLSGYHGSLDHQDVELGLEHQARVRANPLRRERGRGHHPTLLDLADPLPDQLLLDRLLVELLHPPGGLVVWERGDLLEDRVGVVVAGLEPLEVQHGEPAEPTDLHGRLG
jgi:hypothetical protein